MVALLASLPLQLICQLISPNLTVPIDATHATGSESTLEIAHEISPGVMAVKLASLPLELICELIVSNNLAVNGSGHLMATEPAKQTLPEGYVGFPKDNAAYKIHRQYLPWNDARKKCIAENARLAIIDSVDKIKNVKSIKLSTDKWLHVGFHRLNSTEEWLRADNGEPSTIPWKEENPDDIGDCAGLSIVTDGIVNYGCESTGEFYVCEIPIK